MKSTQKYIFPLTPPNFLHYFNAKIAQGESRIIKLAWMLCCAAANLMKMVQPVNAYHWSTNISCHKQYSVYSNVIV